MGDSVGKTSILWDPFKTSIAYSIQYNKYDNTKIQVQVNIMRWKCMKKIEQLKTKLTFDYVCANTLRLCKPLKLLLQIKFSLYTYLLSYQFAMYTDVSVWHLYVLLDFSLTVKAATLIFISGCGSAISSEEEKSGFIFNLVKS